jgi:hypothetical protein
MWQYVIGGATIFGLIVGLFSVYNRRATRRYIGDLIKEETKRTQEILEKLSDQHSTMINILRASRIE